MMVETMDSHSISKDESSAIADSFKQLASDPQLMESALLDCYGRFITLLPDAILKDHLHLYFQIQEAFWWYEDVWREENIYKLPKLSLKDFGLLITCDCPVLKKYVPPSQHEVFLRNWSRYCRTIPLRGAILLNGDLKKCLMVQGWKGGSWMFPRGKVDEMEEDSMCACREIWEEIGVDISPYIDEQVFIETVVEEQPIKLFVVPGIKESTVFSPKKRKEIGNISWIEVKSLPGWNSGSASVTDNVHVVNTTSSTDVSNTSVPGRALGPFPTHTNSLKFWQVIPFVDCLKGWVCLLNKNSSKQRSSLPVKDAPSGIVAFRYQIPPNIPSADLQPLQNADARSFTNRLQLPLLPPTFGGVVTDGNAASNGIRENGRITILEGCNGGSTSESRSALLPQYCIRSMNGFRLPSRRGGRVYAMRLKDVGQRSFDDQDIDHLLALRRRALGFADANVEPTLSNSFVLPKQKRSLNQQVTKGTANMGKVSIKGRGKKTAHASFDDLGVSYQRMQSRSVVRGSPVKDSLNQTTFGKKSASGWSVEEMFKLNAEKFGVMSTYDIAHYTVPLPSIPAKERNAATHVNMGGTTTVSNSTVLPAHTVEGAYPQNLPTGTMAFQNSDNLSFSSSEVFNEGGHFLLSLLKKDSPQAMPSSVGASLPSGSAARSNEDSITASRGVVGISSGIEEVTTNGRSTVLSSKTSSSTLAQPAALFSYMDFQSFTQRLQDSIAAQHECVDTVGTVTSANGHTRGKSPNFGYSRDKVLSSDGSGLLLSPPLLRAPKFTSLSLSPQDTALHDPPLTSPLLYTSPLLPPNPSPPLASSSLLPRRIQTGLCGYGKTRDSPTVPHNGVNNTRGMKSFSPPVNDSLLPLPPPVSSHLLCESPPLLPSVCHASIVSPTKAQPVVAPLLSKSLLSSEQENKYLYSMEYLPRRKHNITSSINANLHVHAFGEQGGEENFGGVTLKEPQIRELFVDDSRVALQKCGDLIQSEANLIDCNSDSVVSLDLSKQASSASMFSTAYMQGNSLDDLPLHDVEWTCIERGMEATLCRHLSQTHAGDGS